MVFSKCLTSGFESFSTITAVKVAISVLRLPGTRVAFQMHEVEQQGPRWRFASEMLPSWNEVKKDNLARYRLWPGEVLSDL